MRSAERWLSEPGGRDPHTMSDSVCMRDVDGMCHGDFTLCQHQQQQRRQQRPIHRRQRQQQQLGVLLLQYPGAAVGCVAELILRVETLNY